MTWPNAQRDSRIDRFRGCLIGVVIGDALGAPVEFMSRSQILESFGADGVVGFAPAYGRVGAITDDTQMTLFTGEGLLRAYLRESLRGIGPVYASVTDCAYARWLITHGETPGFAPSVIQKEDGWLASNQELFSRRARTDLSEMVARKESCGRPRKEQQQRLWWRHARRSSSVVLRLVIWRVPQREA